MKTPKDKLSGDDAIERAIDSRLIVPNHATGVLYNNSGNPFEVKSSPKSGGYLYVKRFPYKSVRKQGETGSPIIYVHRLIAYAAGFPIRGKDIDHINRNRQDNAASNLQSVDKAENHRRGSDISKAKLRITTPSGELVGLLTDARYLQPMVAQFPHLLVGDVLGRKGRNDKPNYMPISEYLSKHTKGFMTRLQSIIGKVFKALRNLPKNGEIRNLRLISI